MSIKDRYQYGPNDKLGEGGFASVYVAYDKTLQRNVALKFYTNKGEHDKSLVNEIRNAINLEHPNLCRYHDVQIENYQNIHGGNDTVEIGIMEFIDGGELDDFLKKQPQYLNKLVKDVLKGLHFLHQKHIIHRDLKPSNILVKNTIDGPVAKIVDFGISKNIDSQKSNSSKLMGTVKYMAPEQFDPATFGINQKIATNVDLWAFGLVLYELVKKEPLVVIKDDLSFSEIANIIHKDIPFYKIEQLPSPYKEMVRVCVVPNANERVKDANDLIEILEGKQYSGSKSTKIIDPENTTTNSTSTSGASFVAKGDYIEGLACVKTHNGVFGFVDTGNNWIITPKYYFLALQKYADFKGRATRKEFWNYVLFNTIFAYGLLGIGIALLGEEAGSVPYIIYILGVLIPGLAVGVRRMHDVGKSGWFLLIPIYSFILAVTQSEPGVNKWGTPQDN